jgi:hypothetical protein
VLERCRRHLDDVFLVTDFGENQEVLELYDQDNALLMFSFIFFEWFIE